MLLLSLLLLLLRLALNRLQQLQLLNNRAVCNYTFLTYSHLPLLLAVVRVLHLLQLLLLLCM